MKDELDKSERQNPDLRYAEIAAAAKDAFSESQRVPTR